MDSFKEGMIVRISCENFVTYNSIECYACPKLNMIVGPNGTGKSSLVNAIVLGLGGKITVIGRAKQLSAYVKSGCKTAKIEIELYSEPSNYVIGRVFNVENKTSWTINGEVVPFKQIETIIQRLNIQVDNLCQFLPQDRVQDFAKMDSKQLLENTLKTVGSNEIVELHTSLKELRGKEVNLDTQTKTMKEQLKSEKMKIARLETEVKTIQEREEVLSNVKIIEKKKAWVEVEHKESHKKEVLQDRVKIMDMKTVAEKNLLPFEKTIQETKEEIKTIDKNINKEIKLGGEKSTAVRRKFEVVANVNDQVDAIKNDLQRKLDNEKKKVVAINKLENEINVLETLVNPEKEDKLARKVTEMLTLIKKKSSEVSSIQTEVQEFEDNVAEVTRTKRRMEGALEREMSAANKKLQILSQRYRDTFRAYEWLKLHRDQFQCQIYGPIMLEINCNEEVAKFVEFTIPSRDLIAFVCEDKNDMNKLLKTVRDEMGLRINVAQATRNFSNPVKQNYQPQTPVQSLKAFGFWSYMIDQVDGPDTVLNYLCANYRLHQIPLGNQLTNSLTEKIPNTISSYFSDSHHFSVRTSKYSGEKSSRMMSLRPSVLLAGSTNTSIITEYKKNIRKEDEMLNKLKKNLDEVKSKISLSERQRDDLLNQKKALDQELMSLRTGRSRLKMRKDELDVFIKEGAFDPELETSNAKRNIHKLVSNVCSEQKTTINFLKTYQDTICKKLLLKVKLSKAQEKLKKTQQESMDATKKLDDCKRMLSRLEDDLKAAQRELKKAQESALKFTDGLSPKDTAFKRKYDQPFATLPSDLEALDAEISRLAARADCLSGGRMSVIEEYNKTKTIIERLETAVAHPEQQLQNLKDEMETKRTEWLPRVMDLIGRINNNFTAFFSLMKCVGEVSLEVPEDKDEYSKYGICIKVQFRETGKLQQLGPHTQSGGERAVSTAIYMLSLQELTTVPFRCVDEINQGMDEYNERVVFKLMVSTVEKANSAQCFLLTPKILHSLEYSHNVKVLCIYSGIGSVSHHEFKVNKFFNRIRRQSNRVKRASLKRKHTDSDSSD